MSLQPLLDAPFVIQIHAWIALALLPLTGVIFALPRGNRLHRTLGWTWVVAMAALAISSFGIQTIRIIGPFSPIHLLSIFVLITLVTGVRAARAHNVLAHRKTMKGLVFGALLLAGAFTLLPGRLMFEVLTGG